MSSRYLFMVPCTGPPSFVSLVGLLPPFFSGDLGRDARHHARDAAHPHVYPATIQPECQVRLQHLRHVGALRCRGRRLLQARAERALGEACWSRRHSGYRAEGDAVRSLADECAAPSAPIVVIPFMRHTLVVGRGRLHPEGQLNPPSCKLPSLSIHHCLDSRLAAIIRVLRNGLGCARPG